MTIENNVLTIAPECLMVKEFSALWNRDKSKQKLKALKELAFVYYTTDYQSIYRNYHPDIRESKIKLDIFDNREWTPDEKVVDAQLKYNELQKTVSMAMLDDIEIGLGTLRTYFREFTPDEDDDGRMTKNFIANVKSMGDLIKGLKSLREEVEKELTDKMQLRGGSVIGRRELPPDRRG